MVKGWREPPHREFCPLNLWSLFSAFTDGLQDGEPGGHREALHGLCDGAVGLAN